MGAGLGGDELLLDAGQEPLAFGQGQAHAGQVGEVPGLGDLQDIGAVLFSLGSEAHQSHDPSHVASTPTEKPAREYRLPLSRPQSRDNPLSEWQNQAKGTHAALMNRWDESAFPMRRNSTFRA